MWNPRVGGEKLRRASPAFPFTGSPPRRRGKGKRVPGIAQTGGITPAWAGKRVWHPCSGRCGWDHPRMGGEKSLGFRFVLAGPGSPPRGRGKGHAALAGVLVGRITPAQAGKRQNDQDDCSFYKDHPRKAGKRLTRPAMTGTPRDHPRVGGEKGGAWWIIILFLGSPPHGRGKGGLPCGPHLGRGITPAWAGKSLATLAERGN